MAPSLSATPLPELTFLLIPTVGLVSLPGDRRFSGRTLLRGVLSHLGIPCDVDFERVERMLEHSVVCLMRRRRVEYRPNRRSDGFGSQMVATKAGYAYFSMKD